MIDLSIAKNCFNGEVLIIVGNEPFYERTVGFRDLATKEPLFPNSLYNIGSVSKPITSVAVLQLQEKHLLNIEDFVKKYIPEFPYDNIRIKHLLSHTSGIAANLDFLDSSDNALQLNNDSILGQLNNYLPPLLFIPGSAWAYSNMGYDLLAVLVERVSRMTFADYLQQNIFAPAGMDRTFIPSSSNILAWLPKGLGENAVVVPHMFANLSACEVIRTDSVGPFPRADHYFVGSSNVYTTASDLAKFDRAMRNDVVLSRSAQELAYAPFVLTTGDTAKDPQAPIPSYYGLGWSVSIDTTGGRIIWHKGRSYGTRAIFLRNPSKEQCVVALDNFDHNACDLKGIACMRIINDRPYRNPVRNSLVQELGCGIHVNGFNPAFVEFDRLKATEGQNYYISSDELLALSDELIGQARSKDALSVLDLGKELFPASFEVFAARGNVQLGLKNMVAAAANYTQAGKLYGTTDDEHEALLNDVGYQFLMTNRLADAIWALKLNTELFPRSCNTYDSYASALEMNDQLELAIENEEKAVAIAIDQKHELLPTLQENLENLKQKMGK